MAESFSREKIKASTAERRWMENPVLPSSCVTPAGTSIEVQNEWEETQKNTLFSGPRRGGLTKQTMILPKRFDIFSP